VHQPVEDLVHAIAAQGDHRPDRHALAQLEVRDRLLGARDHGLLPADRRQLLDRGVEQLGVLRRLAEPHVEHDLLQAWHGQRVLEAEVAHERRGDLGAVALAQAGGHAHSPPSGSPQRRQMRSPRPSGSRRWPTRVGLLHLAQMGTTLERWIDASFSWMPPGCCTPRGFTCRFTMLTRSMSTRSRSPSTRNTLPVRTITAFVTSRFFTLALGMASLTDTMITSPIEAYLRRVPPSTLMQSTLRAPLLSATSRMVSAWITSAPRSRPAPRPPPPRA